MTDRRQRDRAKRPTLSAVAQAAQVSTATASKVLNNRPDVAPQTRERVEAALRDVGYQPSTGPRDVRHSPVITVVFDTLVNLYSTQVLRGVLAAAHELGVDIVVEVADDHGESFREPVGATRDGPLSTPWIREVARKGWLGVVVVTMRIAPAQVRALRDANLFLVAIDPANVTDDSVVSVGSTNFHGGQQATNHLIELGHRRIGLAGGPARSAIARERLHGFRSALEAADIPPENQLIMHGAFSYEAGVEMTLLLLSRKEPPTAIVAGCDATALGVLEGARQMGVQVPQELSVVGFDDTPAAISSAPPLTTIRQPMTGLGRVALRSLLQQALGEAPVSHHIQLATSLIVRQTTGPPPGQDPTISLKGLAAHRRTAAHA